ncbi:MAG TPA: acyltransferase [Pseudoxanthomonas sp.]
MKYPGLDLLRAIAIVWVMLFHSFLVDGLGEDYSWLSRYGWMGVDLFFVLSGFLIGTQVLKPLARGDKLSFRDFYLKRAFRILPAFWVVLALYLLWPGLREAPGMEPWWKFAGFFVNLSIDYANNAAFSHAWSLCVEEHFYLLFPLLAWWLTRRPSALKFAAVCVTVVLLGIGLRTGVWLHETAIDPPRAWFVEDIYYPTWNRLDGLLFGVVLATAKTFRPQFWERAQRYANPSLIAGLVVMALSFWLFRDRVGLLGNSIGWPVLSLGLALLVFAGASANSVIGHWRVPGAGWLAAVSYSLYLVHKAVFHLVQAQWGDVLQGRGFVAFCIYGAASLLAAAALHYAVEKPFLRMRERVLSRRAATQAVVGAT